MTGPDDEMTAALVRTLRHHAEEAPSADGLPEQAMAVAARRRRRRVHASIAAIVVLVVAIPVAVMAAVRGDDSQPAAEDPAWRWESYEDAQVRVPADWTWTTGGPAHSWCQGVSKYQPRPGLVGRPGPVATVGCVPEWGYPPADQRTNWLSFNSTDKVGVHGFDQGWVEETRLVGNVFVTLFTNEDTLRAAIFRTARPIVGVDHNGCPAQHQVIADPRGYRPAEGGLPPAGAVESISVCRYALPSNSAGPANGGHPLLASGRITGEDAKKIVTAILAAPEGVGPDVEGASPGDTGTEIAVLRIETTDGAREVVVRYAGESGNSFDDGQAKHRLTADAIRPLLTGATLPGQFYLPVAPLFDE